MYNITAHDMKIMIKKKAIPPTDPPIIGALDLPPSPVAIEINLATSYSLLWC